MSPAPASPLADADRIAARRRALCRPSLRPLTALARQIRDTGGLSGLVPDADPMDGGVRAELLLLLERPGAGALPAGIVSRDNGTPTARNLRGFLREAGLPRGRTLIWNVVPWAPPPAPDGRVRNRAPDAAELAAGLSWLLPLLDLLPRLRVVVLAGRPAARAAPLLAEARPGLPVLHMPHPSPTILCTSPEIPARIRATLSAASRCLS